MSVASRREPTADLALEQEALRFSRLRANLGLSPSPEGDIGKTVDPTIPPTDWVPPIGDTQRDHTQRDHTQRDHTQRDHTQLDHIQGGGIRRATHVASKASIVTDLPADAHAAGRAGHGRDRYVPARSLRLRPFARGLVLGGLAALVLAGIEVRTKQAGSSDLTDVSVGEPAPQQVAALHVPEQAALHGPEQDVAALAPDELAALSVLVSRSAGGRSDADTPGPLGGTLLTELIDQKYRPYSATRFLHFNVPSSPKDQSQELDPLPTVFDWQGVDPAAIDALLRQTDIAEPPVLVAIDDRPPIRLTGEPLVQPTGRCSGPRPRASADESMSFGQFASNLVSDLGEIGGCLF